MSRYIQQIVEYFFHHDVKGDIVTRVQQRILLGGHDAEDAFRKMWAECDEVVVDDAKTEKAFAKLSSALQNDTCDGGHLHWLKIAAIWLIPVIMLSASAYFYISATQKDKLYSKVEFIHRFTAYGERSRIVLPDSSVVWLNGGSSLTYPSTFSPEERNVCLVGEGFFEVKKNTKRPFTVDINKMKLKVVGTSFNVFSYPSNPQVTVTLQTGKLKIDMAGQKKSYMLQPNDQLLLDTKTGKTEMRHVNAVDYSIWRVPTLYFEETKLVYVLQQIERAYNVKIHIQNSRYNNQTIRAHFNTNEKIEDIMCVIKMLIPQLNYEIDGNEIFIK